MHKEAISFITWVSQQFPLQFENKIVLDVGSGDINGNNRRFFTNCEQIGNDVATGANVTVVSFTSKLPFVDEYFDTVVSTECFEHDPEYSQSFQKIAQMLKPGGLFAFTCASTDRPEHGTRRTSVKDSFGTLNNIECMQDYYKNLTLNDLKSIPNFLFNFSWQQVYYEPSHKDLFFCGIKKSGKETVSSVPFYPNAQFLSK